ncbi:hypothetical protein Tco_0482613 [Tanacetum coccineum]
MHESGDLHAFWRSFHVQDFFFVSLHEILRGLRPLLDVMYLHWIRMCFVCGDIFPKCCPQIFSVVMDSFRSLFEPDSRSFPVSVELYMWHHIGIAISLSLQRTEIALYGLPDPHFRRNDPLRCLRSRLIRVLRDVVALMTMFLAGTRFPLLGLWWLTIRECLSAGSFLPSLLNTPPSFRGRSLGEGGRFCLSLLGLVTGFGSACAHAFFSALSGQLAFWIRSSGTLHGARATLKISALKKRALNNNGFGIEDFLLVKIYSMAGSDDENPPPPPPQTPTQQAPHTVSTIKLPILKKGVSTEDANQKFLRSLPSSWSQVSLVMRTKPGVDSLSFDDLYNNLRVFESDVKGSTGSSSSAQNVAFVSSESTSSTNDVSTAYGVSTSSGYNSQRENSSSYTDEPCYSIFANQSEEPKALVTIDGEGVDWTGHVEDKQENFALMAYSNSGSETEVTSCSKECMESYAKLKKLYDTQREQLGDASIEIQAYTQALKKVEAQLVAHQQSQLWYEEKIRFMNIDLDDKTDVLTYHKKLLAEAEKEKEDLKAKVEKWHNSSKNLR